MAGDSKAQAGASKQLLTPKTLHNIYNNLSDFIIPVPYTPLCHFLGVSAANKGAEM